MTVNSKHGHLFNEVATTLSTLGVGKTIEVLQEARKNRYKDNHAYKVMITVTEALGITFIEMQQLNARKDNRKVGIALCVHFLYNEFNQKYIEISRNLKIGLSISSLASHHDLIKSANLKNPKSDIDKMIAKHLPELTPIINKIKTEQNDNGNFKKK